MRDRNSSLIRRYPPIDPPHGSAPAQPVSVNGTYLLWRASSLLPSPDFTQQATIKLEAIPLGNPSLVCFTQYYNIIRISILKRLFIIATLLLVDLLHAEESRVRILSQFSEKHPSRSSRCTHKVTSQFHTFQPPSEMSDVSFF